MDVAIEAKASRKISDNHLKGLRRLKEDQADIKRRIVVCCEDKPRTTGDGIEIIPAVKFSQLLWQGNVF